MSSPGSNWRMSRDWRAIISFYFLVLPCGLLSTVILSSLSRVREGDPALLYVALSMAGVGIILLFCARLPLYQQHKYFSVGPKSLPLKSRRLYWVAYVFLGLSVAIMLLILVRIGGP